MADVGVFVRWSLDLGGNTVSPDGINLFNYLCVFIHMIKDLEPKPKKRRAYFSSHLKVQ